MLSEEMKIHQKKSTVPQQGTTHVRMLTASMICAALVVGCAAEPYVIGLKPEAPFAERIAEIDTLRPTFRWEHFPRQKDRQELGPRSERVAAVTYEFRLWKVGTEFSGPVPSYGAYRVGQPNKYKYSWSHECRDTDPGELVQTQQGLVTPEYRVETTLQPNSLYFWTVRAHFTLDGKRRVTEWSEQLPGFAPSLSEGFKTDRDGCSYLAHFHLIRTP